MRDQIPQIERKGARRQKGIGQTHEIEHLERAARGGQNEKLVKQDKVNRQAHTATTLRYTRDWSYSHKSASC